MRLAWLAALATLCAGCTSYRDEVSISVRDPSLVAVGASGAIVLPAGAVRGDIPPTAYLRDPATGATVERATSAAALRSPALCPACRGADVERVIFGCSASRAGRRSAAATPAFDPATILLHDTPDAVRVADGEVRARYTIDDRVVGRRGGLHRRPRMPVANVASIEASRLVRDRPGAGLAVLGIFEVVLGGLLVDLGVHDRSWAFAADGGAFLALGAGALVAAWIDCRARNRTWMVPLR